MSIREKKLKWGVYVKAHQVFNELRSVSSNVLDGLKDIDFAVLDDLLDARICGKVDAHAGSAVAV